MIGWAAVTGNIALEPFLLFLIIFLWTPPHFWALSLLRVDDYARARVPMLPVVAGPDETRRQILLYSLVLAPVGLTPWLFGQAGVVYGVTAIIAGAVMIGFAWRVNVVREGEGAARAARGLFSYSILYLFALFAMLLIERGMTWLTSPTESRSPKCSSAAGARARSPSRWRLLPWSSCFTSSLS
jgi:protoheme IX farnesyltransferase